MQKLNIKKLIAENKIEQILIPWDLGLGLGPHSGCEILTVLKYFRIQFRFRQEIRSQT